MSELQTIVATASASLAAGLLARHLWDRWRAPDRLARRVEDRYVTVRECTRCEQSSGARFDRFEQTNREDHQALFDRLDALKDMLARCTPWRADDPAAAMPPRGGRG